MGGAATGGEAAGEAAPSPSLSGGPQHRVLDSSSLASLLVDAVVSTTSRLAAPHCHCHRSAVPPLPAAIIVLRALGSSPSTP